MKVEFTGFAKPSAIKTTRWVKNQYQFKGKHSFLRIPVICKKQIAKNRVAYKVTVEYVDPQP